MSTESFTPAPTAAEPSSNERLLAALCYPLWPIVSLFILLVEEHKQKAFERYHAVQALGVGAVLWVIFLILSIIVSLVTFGFGALCTPFLLIALYVALVYWAYRAYQGQSFDVPFVTKFMRDQKLL